jgi:GNAT superfamily N-acetyltransferase
MTASDIDIAQDFVIGIVSAGDLNAIVDVHMAAFPGFFLTELGAAFVRQMYLGFLADPAAVFLAARHRGAVAGFAVGFIGGGHGHRRVALRRAPALALAVLPALARRPVFLASRLVAKLLCTDGTPATPLDAIMLRSIAVQPRFQGGVAARSLLAAFEALAHERGATRCVLTTDADNNGRVNRFYVREGYRLSSIFMQHGKRRMYLYEKVLGPPRFQENLTE